MLLQSLEPAVHFVSEQGRLVDPRRIGHGKLPTGEFDLADLVAIDRGYADDPKRKRDYCAVDSNREDRPPSSCPACGAGLAKSGILRTPPDFCASSKWLPSQSASTVARNSS